MLQVSISV